MLNLEIGTATGLKSIQRVKPDTSIGLENFSRVFLTPDATESIDAALSVGATIVAEGNPISSEVSSRLAANTEF